MVRVAARRVCLLLAFGPNIFSCIRKGIDFPSRWQCKFGVSKYVQAFRASVREAGGRFTNPGAWLHRCHCAGYFTVASACGRKARCFAMWHSYPGADALERQAREAKSGCCELARGPHGSARAGPGQFFFVFFRSCLSSCLGLATSGGRRLNVFVFHLHSFWHRS